LIVSLPHFRSYIRYLLYDVSVSPKQFLTPFTLSYLFLSVRLRSFIPNL
jgi:hypothetical protein